MSTTTTQSSSGIGFAGMLTILFIGLKLTGYINWSWWWVLSPLWIGLALVIGILLIVIIGFIIKLLITPTRPKKAMLQNRFQQRLNSLRKS